MSNNTVTIRGLILHRPVGVQQPSANIGGWIYTDRGIMGGRHPFIALEQRAEIIMNHVREYKLRPVDDPPDLPNRRDGVLVRGKLVSLAHGSYLDVRNVNFFRATLSLKKFSLNDLTLDGDVLARDRALRSEMVGRFEVPALDVLLRTDASDDGGTHLVTVFKTYAHDLLARFRQNHFRSFKATVGGRLVTKPTGSLIHASFVCPEDEGML